MLIQNRGLSPVPPNTSFSNPPPALWTEYEISPFFDAREPPAFVLLDTVECFAH
jgi:hypothetical protein